MMPEKQSFTLRRLFLARAKLKATSRTSALLSGFAMVAMVEAQVQPGVSRTMQVAFAICTTLVVAVHLLALMISTCILPNIEASATLSTLDSSLHETMHWYIELAWILSTGVGIILFLIQMAVLAWVRFHGNQQNAATASTCIIVPMVFVFIAFAVHFYRQLISVKVEHSTRELQELSNLQNELGSNLIQNV